MVNFFSPPFQNDGEKSNNNNENVNPAQTKQEKTTYGRLRVLTAPPTSVANVHELGQDATGSPRDSDNLPFQYDVKVVSGSESRKNRRHRPNSGSSVNLQRLNSSGTNRDHSITQFALIDDENVSALQQMTKGGGGLTLASQWKSQFDDSEETTDNEWKQEPQSPDHQKIQYVSQHHQQQHPHYHTLPHHSSKHHQSNSEQMGNIKSSTQPQSLQTTPSQPVAPMEKDMNQTQQFYIQHKGRRDEQMLKQKLKKKKKCVAITFYFLNWIKNNFHRSRSHLNIAGIENFPNIQDHLPHCWSEPALGNILRHNLEPPLLQQAAFDDTVSVWVSLILKLNQWKSLVDLQDGHQPQCWRSRHLQRRQRAIDHPTICKAFPIQKSPKYRLWRVWIDESEDPWNRHDILLSSKF